MPTTQATGRVALIAGVTGQDGSYLAELLLRRGYAVYGITRDPGLSVPLNLRHLDGRVKLIYSAYELAQLIDIIRNVKPDEIYDLAGQSYVSKSWEMVEETIRSIAVIPSRLLEAIVATNPAIRFLHASSSEIFGPADGAALSESSRVAPANPYGCSKAFAHHMVGAYRTGHGVFAANAVLFSHESPRRHASFLVKKVVRHALEIQRGRRDKLRLGNLAAIRDWGYAPEYVNAMHLMLRADAPDDYCLCTGVPRSVSDVAQSVFGALGLDWERHVEVDTALVRRYEAGRVLGSARKAQERLGWTPKVDFAETIDRMIDFERKLLTYEAQDYRNESPQFD